MNRLSKKLISYLKNIYHYLLAHLAGIVYLNPSKHLFVVGVTGTKGKTTVTELINAGLEEAGYKTALISSIRRKVGLDSEPNRGNSMPGRFHLQSFLRRAAKAKCDVAIVEVTSEGVVQSRHRHIDYDAGVFLGLHPEHIESHGSFEKYRRAKLDFFKYIKSYSKKLPKFYFINAEDWNAKKFVAEAEDKKNPGRSRIFLFFRSHLKSQLPGEFNKINIGAAESFLMAVGVPPDAISRAIADFKGVAGRMETIIEKPFKVVVDYAHTPDALEAVYQTLSDKRQATSDEGIEARKLVCVLGSAGGGRDKWKRPEFGRLAAKYCREIILTDEDPYDEDPKKILSEVKSGITNSQLPIPNAHTILDRKEAIRRAVSIAKVGDTVVITGKGSERTIHVAHGKAIPWSDREIAREALANLNYETRAVTGVL